MNGVDGGAAWDSHDDEGNDEDKSQDKGKDNAENNTSADSNKRREGKWESGKGRCPVTGRRVLGGTDCLRRVLI